METRKKSNNNKKKDYWIWLNALRHIVWNLDPVPGTSSCEDSEWNRRKKLLKERDEKNENS